MSANMNTPARPPLRKYSSDYETPVRRGARPSGSKKKVNKVSEASLALLSPAYAMGFEMEGSWSQDSAKSLPVDAPSWAQSPDASRYGPGEAAYRSDLGVTPELEAFAVDDLQTALSKTHKSEGSTDGEMWESKHQRGATLASVFEDDADAPSPKPESSRRVAFRVRGGSQDSTKEAATVRNKGGHSKSASTQSSVSANSPASTFARLFNWKKGAGKRGVQQQAGFSDVFDAQPSSAPPHITTFDRSMPPPLDYDSQSDATSACGSLPATPLGGATITLPAGTTTPTKLMPHRRAGPAPRSILRKQSAPALRPVRPSVEHAPLPLRSFEEPNSLPSSSSSSLHKQLSPRSGPLRQQPPSPLFGPSAAGVSPSQSSFTERRYSTVGRGVARCRQTSDATLSTIGSSSSSSLASSVKSPTRKSGTAGRPSVNKRFEGMPNSPSVNPLLQQGLRGQISGPMSPPGSLFSLPEQKSLAAKVAGGAMNHARGFEEPAPRSDAANALHLDVHGAQGPKTLRRRSRSVGALEGQAIIAGLGSTTTLAQAPSTRFVGLGRGQPQVASARPQLGRLPMRDTTPTQQSVAAFSGPPPALDGQGASSPTGRHKSKGSLDSSSSDEELAEAAVVTTAQARRVQLVGTRAKATTVSSPNLSRSPNLRSPVPVVNVLPPSSPSMFLSSPEAATPASATVLRRPMNAPTPPRLLSADLDEDTLRKRWSKRDSCILALALAQVDLSDNDEGLGIDVFPSGPGYEQPVTGLGLQTTAPLNIKPRKSPREPAQALPPSSSVASSTSGNPFPYSASDNSVTTSSDATEHAQQSSPQIYTFAPSDSYGSEATTESLPSLDSSSTSSVASSSNRDFVNGEGASPAKGASSPTPGGLCVMPASTSMTSIVTVGTSIFEYGMPQEEAKRYVHRANLSEDGFAGAAGVDGADAFDESTTPTLSNGPFGTLPAAPAAINVSHHHTQESLSMGAVQEVPKNLLELDLSTGGHLGLSLSPLAANHSPATSPRLRAMSPSARRSPSPVSVRSITPTQERQTRSAQKSEPAQDVVRASMGLGLDLGQVKVAEPGFKAGKAHPQLAGEVGAGHWEDELYAYRQQHQQQQRRGPAALYHNDTTYHYDRQHGQSLHEPVQEWEMGVAL
ncbi:unnamed protein product [Parajaminaea phylloscopi]